MEYHNTETSEKVPEKVLVQRINETGRILRRFGLLRAAVILLTFLCGSVLLAVLAEHWIFKNGLSIPLRCGILTAQIFFVLWFAYRQIVPFFRYRINPAYSAVLLEKQTSAGKNSLLNWFFLRREYRDKGKENKEPDGFSPRNKNKIAELVLEGVAKNAVQNVSPVLAAQTIEEKDIRRWGIILFSILVIFAAYQILSPKNPLPSMQRLFLPFSSAAVPQSVQFLNVEPGNTTVLQGDKINVSVRTVSKFRKKDEPVELFFSTDDGSAAGQSLPMNEDGSSVYSAAFPPGKQGFFAGTDYWFQQGESKSIRYRIEVQPVASLELETVKIKEPDYTGLPEKTQDIAGDITAVEGSEVQMFVRSSLPLENCKMLIETSNTETNGKESEQKELKAVDDDRKKFQVRFNLQTAENNVSIFYFQGLDTNGNKTRSSGRFRLEVLPDFPPLVKWVNEEELLGAGQIEVPLNSALELKVQANDPDYALRYLRLRIVSGNKQIQPIELLESSSGGITEHTGTVEKEVRFSPIKSRLTVGDIAEIWAEAVDVKLPIPNKSETPRLNVKIAESKIQNKEKTDDNKVNGNKAEKRKTAEEQTGEENKTEQNGKQNDNAPEQPQNGEKQNGKQEKEEQQKGQNGEQSKEQNDGQSEKNEQNGEQKQDGSGTNENKAEGRKTPEQPLNGEENPGDVIEKILEQMKEDKEQQQQKKEEGGNQQGNQGEEQNTAQKEKNEEKNDGGKNSESGGIKGPSGSDSDEGQKNEEKGEGTGSEGQKGNENNNGAEDGKQENNSTGNGAEGRKPSEKQNGEQGNKNEEEQKNNNAGQSKTEKGTKNETEGGRQRGNPNSEENEKKDDFPDADKRNVPVDPNDNESRERADLDPGKDERRNQGSDKSNPKPVPQDLPNDTITSGDEGHGQESTDSGRSERLQKSESGKEGQSGNQAESQEKVSPSTSSTGENQETGTEREKDNTNRAEGRKTSEEQTGNSEKQSNNQPQDGNQDNTSAGSEQSNAGGKQPSDDMSKENKSQTGNSQTTGATGGGSGFNTDTETEAARLDYAEKTTNLVLEYLDEQLKDKPDKKLLDKLGCTEEQLRAYRKKWKELAEQSKQNEKPNGAVPQKPDQWKEFLKSIGLTPEQQHSSVQQSKTAVQENKPVSETQRYTPPDKLRERFKRYTEGIGK